MVSPTQPVHDLLEVKLFSLYVKLTVFQYKYFLVIMSIFSSILEIILVY